MQFGILGPLEVRHGGAAVPVGGVQRRALLARLLLEPRRSVAAHQLIDDLWGEAPPTTARKTLQKYVSELRRVLPEPVLATSVAGYLLDIDPEDIDAARFESLVAAGDFSAALALWRGDVLADLAEFSFTAPERVRLDELRLVARQRRLEAELDQGRHQPAVAALAELVQQHPHREPLVALYMAALYRSGRQGDALAVYERHRRQLDADLGIEPGAELRDLHVAILRQEPSLDKPAARPTQAQRPKGNLPASLTSFVGRAAELRIIEERLLAHRLLTITGPGGIGKTRLAVEVARRAQDRFDDGVWLVDLAKIARTGQIASTVALALRVDLRHAEDDIGAIAANLAEGSARLLVFDNCEHLIDACAQLAQTILLSCPAVTVLATSRQPLGAEGEFVLRLPSLPGAVAEQLFIDRAQMADHQATQHLSQADVAELCTCCEGIPLAIELAAAQLRVLSMPELRARIGDHLAFRRAGSHASPRQATLRDMVAWSFALLSEPSKQLFARLGVFRGSLTLTGAEAVAAELTDNPADVLEHVTALVDHSLLLRIDQPSGESRFRLLEPLRLFALERLADLGAVESTRSAHAAYLLLFAQDAARHIYGPDEQTWQRRLEAEAANLEAALAWSVQHSRPLALDLTAALWPYWEAGWGERTALRYLDQLLAVPDQPSDYDRRAWALVVAADMAANRGDARKAVPWARNAVRSFRAEGDQLGRARALIALGAALGAQGANDEATQLMTDAVAAAEQLGDDVLTARALDRSHFVAARRGDHQRADELARQELARWRKIGSRRGEAGALRHEAVSAYRLGDLDRSEMLCDQALSLWQDIDDPAAIAHVQTTLGDIARARGDTARAARLYQTALGNLRAIGDRRCEASTYKNLAVLAAHDTPQHAISLFLDAIRLRNELGDEAGLAECLEGLADTLHAFARHAESVTMLAAAEAIRAATNTLRSAAEQLTFETLEAAERALLGDADYQHNWQLGHRMAAPEIIDFVAPITAQPAATGVLTNTR